MEKGKRGGDMKKAAPPGYYTAKEAAARLGLNASTFRYYVQQGKINRYVPPLRHNGYYAKGEINRMATEMALFLHTSAEAANTSETRVARPEDTPGIVKVLTIMGWQTATSDQRAEWYRVNPFIDYVVIFQNEVMGYINASPYKPAAMEGIMSGRKRSWHMTPQDFYSYERGKTYDLYVGIATRQDIPNNTRFGFRLLSGFMDFLIELAKQGILIRRMYAISDQKDGQELSTNLGFVLQPAQEGDKFPRYMLDLETSSSLFARQYRKAIEEQEE